MGATSDPRLPDPAETERLKLRPIVADIDAERAQATYEPRKFVLQAITTAAALVGAGVALGAFLAHGG
jgi:hypothetical protein